MKSRTPDNPELNCEQGELFERVFCASFPPPECQARIALDDMLAGKRLRQSDWLHIGWRLAAAIMELKYLGWVMDRKPVRIVGRKRPITEYSLPQWVLREIAKSGAHNG